MTLQRLDVESYRETVRRALAEDLGTAGDVTTAATVPADARARGQFLVKADCVLAGLDVAFEAFRMLEPTVQVSVRKPDGERCAPGDSSREVAGSARTLLVAERTALNFLQRLSGIATAPAASSKPPPDDHRPRYAQDHAGAAGCSRSTPFAPAAPRITASASSTRF